MILIQDSLAHRQDARGSSCVGDQTLKRQREASIAHSQTARFRIKIADILNDLTQSITEFLQLLALLDERAHQRKPRIRQEKEACDERREEQRRHEREEYDRRKADRAKCEARRHEMMMTLLASDLTKRYLICLNGMLGR
ncbi:hypothetical protein GN244_ATG04632 [Phytophthora infestans]|uniref:Uncharacterized protein n=1 Tax=Phytophthora infestans TaxID=4787 RepID=A0A833SZV3_PHYIN|nr:hypothetical protein GN244_ATG04632 [Phytophthora infestans]